MLVLGLDVANYSGVCWLETSQPPSEWRCYAVQAEGDFGEEKYGDLGVYIHGEVRTRRPDFVAIEMPQRNIMQYGGGYDGEDDLDDQIPTRGEKKRRAPTINPNALQLTGLAGGVVAVLDVCGIPWGLIAPGTWRSAYYGKGFQPPHGDWKAAAIRQAEIEGIVLPPTKKAQKDAAEAVGIARAWAKCTKIPKRYQTAFMNLRMGNPRAAA